MLLAAPVPSSTPRRSRTARRALAVLAAAAPLVLALTGPATAAPSAGTAESATAAAPAPATAAPHCAVIAGSATPHCFATFRAAVAYGTGGRVTDAPVSARTAATDATFTRKMGALPATAVKTAATSGTTPATAAAASVLLGVEYADANYLGASVSFFGATRCDNSSDADFRFASMPAGWNDRITSFKSFSNCAQQLFRSTSFTGGSLTIIIVNLANVGSAANDQASSLTFN
jgi:hypothetical protein